ncbi:hypothetical protein BT69DRAFT_589043 [Atractiella rhizophila]|nr:hypothetical protein BT69DRAFT_589043 [Atractiella rhizophila]
MSSNPTTFGDKKQSHTPPNTSGVTPANTPDSTPVNTGIDVIELSYVQRKGIARETQGRFFRATKGEFLARFFQGYGNKSISSAEVTKWMNTINNKYPKETDIYDPIIELLNEVCKASNLRFFNVHKGSDPKVSSLNRPDFFAVDTEEVRGTKCCGHCDEGHRLDKVCWLHSELVGDFKLLRDEDPFDERVNLTQNRIKALNQLLYYLFNISQTKHRTSALLIFIFRGSGRLIRWSPKFFTISQDFFCFPSS